MFNIGPEEVLLILVIALVILGPQKLPDMARQIGRGLREFRNLSNNARQELLHNVNFDEPDEVLESPVVPNGKVKGSKKPKAGGGAAAVAEDGASPGGSEATESILAEPSAPTAPIGALPEGPGTTDVLAADGAEGPAAASAEADAEPATERITSAGAADGAVAETDLADR